VQITAIRSPAQGLARLPMMVFDASTSVMITVRTPLPVG